MTRNTRLAPYVPRPLPPAPAASDLQRVGEFFNVALRHKWIIALCLLAGAAGGGVYCTESKPLYQSKAEVFVTKRDPRTFTAFGGQSTSVEDDIGMHLTLLVSPVFTRRVVEERNLGALATLQNVPDPVATVLTSFSAMRDLGDPSRGISGAGVLDFSYKGPIPEDCPAIINAFIETYQEFLNETSRKMNEEALGLLTRKAESVHGEVRAAEEKYREFRKSTPLWQAKDSANSPEGRVVNLEAKKADLEVQRAKVESHMAAIKRAVANGADTATVLALAGESSQKDNFAAMESALFPLLMKEKELMENFGPDHPDVQAVRRQIALVKDYYAPSSAVRASLGVQSIEPADSRQPAVVKAYTRLLQQELDDIASSETALAKLLQEQNLKAQQLQSFEFEDRQLSNEIARLEQFYQSLVDQLHSVDVSRELVGYSMNVIAPPLAAVQIAPRWQWVAAISLAAALLVGYGIAFLIELSDRSFHSPAEVTRRLGLPVVAHIPLVTGPRRRRAEIASQPRLDPVLCTYHRPASPEAEAYRALRTTLFFSTHGEKFKVIQITSPNPGDGKTAMVSNLAVSLAQLGRKVLLIDADLRWPQLHRIFGLSAPVGLASVINDEVEPNEAIQPSGIAGLWVLPGGAIPPNPADLLTSPRFKELLDHVRDQYDFVLVDTPAFLAVTDARIVAPRVDGVLLAIRVTKNGRPRVERCREILATLDAALLGVVVNVKDRHRNYETCDFEDYHTEYLYRHAGEYESQANGGKQTHDQGQRLSALAGDNGSIALLPQEK